MTTFSKLDALAPNSGPLFPKGRSARCWAQHKGVVSDLTVLKTWHDGLREGIDWAGGVQGWHEWRVFLDRVGDDLQTVGQMCVPIHQAAMLSQSLAKKRRGDEGGDWWSGSGPGG